MREMVAHDRIQPPRRPGFISRLLFWAMKRRLGQVPFPAEVKSHIPALLLGDSILTAALAADRSVPPKLKALGVLRTATLIGCPF